MRPLSHSSLSLYLQCPLKYKFQYIDGLKEKPRSYLSFGSSVHDALEYFFGEKFFTPPSLEDVFEYYEKNWISEGYADKEEENKYFEEGKHILSDFYEKHTKPYKRPLAVEHQLLFEVNGVKIKGYVDRIDKIDDKSVEVIDYKTSKNPFTLTDLKEEPQLTMYQLGIEQEMGLRVEKLTYYHLLSQTPFTVPRHDDQQVEQLKERIATVAKCIEQEEFPHKQNRFCPCDFGNLCPLYMHNYKKEVEKEEKAIDIVKVVDEYGKLKDQDKELSARAKVLQEEIKEYLDKESVERVFGDKYEVTRSKMEKEMLDATKARAILEAKHLLDEVIYKKEIATIRYKEKKELKDDKLSA